MVIEFAKIFKLKKIFAP